jgi:hypothetical protein
VIGVGILDVYGFFRRDHPAEPGFGSPDARFMEKRSKLRRYSEPRQSAKRPVGKAEHDAEMRLADAHRICQHRLKDRFELARRAADDAEHLRGRGLLLQRLA